MNTTMLDELTTALARMTKGTWATHDEVPRAIVSMDDPDMSLLAIDRDGMAVFDKTNDAEGVVALVNAAPALLAASAQLRDVTEERDAAQYLAERRGADLDVLRAQLRNVTAQYVELREATNELTDALLAAGDIDAFTPGWMRTVDALAAAR